ncbi:MAG: M3 family oligoendopeptidase [Lactobacillus sp.]|jgi:oligoendopeptidase F|nr:M3 family oligoendopeptidase [Lactobacillus sp.]
MKEKNSKLPAWNLKELYNSIDDPKIEKDLAKYKKLTEDFTKKYKGKLGSLNAKEFYEALKKYEEKSSLARLLYNFGSLNKSTQQKNQKATAFAQNLGEKLKQYGMPSIFFTLELNSLPQKKIDTLLKDKSVAKYAPYIKSVRKFKDYQLSEEVEEILSQKSITSTSAWVRLYSENASRLEFTVRGKKYSDAEIGKLTLDKNAELRKEAGVESYRVRKENGKLSTYIYNMIMKDKAIEDEKRGFKTPASEMNLYNRVDDKVTDTLAATVKDSYKSIAHRFYKLKAKWMGLKKLENWDRNAPLPFENDKDVTWDEAVKTVLDAYKRFSPKLHKVAKDFFDNPWIDVPPRDGKRGGAFAAPVSTTLHPFLFLNFTGKQTDVLTLAHELGHGCHMQLAKVQGELNEDTPLVLAEVASVFGEMITFRSLLDKTKDDKQKLAMIASKVNDMINTSHRQISYHFFETRAHNERKQGEVSEERLCEIWNEEVKQNLGPSVNINKYNSYGWSGIPHLYHTPFYVYAYSFADCLVNSLYGVYTEGKVKDFEDKYLHMLSETGIKKYDELLKPFGLDANKKDFWNKGLKVISDYIDELEKLDKKLKL